MNKYAVLVLTALLALFCSTGMRVLAADEVALVKVVPASVKVAQFGADDKEICKAQELSDGNDRTRWMCRTPVAPLYLEFDLGLSTSVGKLRFANYFTGNNPTRGLKLVDIFITAKPFSAADTTAPLLSKTMTISDATGPAWTDILLDTPQTGQYITLRVKNNWGAPIYAANELEIYTVTDAEVEENIE